jgi:protein SCO1/2
MMRATKILLALSLGFACGCQHIEKQGETLPFYSDADFTPKWTEANSAAYDSIHSIAPFAFVNQDGDTISEKTFEGKICVADFFFTSCGGICPTMTANMKKIQDAFKDDDEVLLLSHSVTPEMDSVSVLREYARSVGAITGKWHLVTGAKEAIYQIARKSYFADEDLGEQRSEDDFLHTENFLLIDKKRRIRGVYKGTFPLEISRLIEDIRILQSE